MASVAPGGRVLWCLRRRSSDVSCVLYSDRLPVEVQVLQDRDIVLSELFPEEILAQRWATAFGDRLKLQGWRDAPDP
jgi:hypothetical protein